MAIDSSHRVIMGDGVSIVCFSRLFLYLLETRTCMKSRTSSNFDQIRPQTTELIALERLKKKSPFIYTYGKNGVHFWNGQYNELLRGLYVSDTGL